jgi:hypothetical protein
MPFSLSMSTTTVVEAFVSLFAIVVMPGIANNLDTDQEFWRALQVIDSVIQANQPIFILVWMGYVVSMICLAGTGLVMTPELAISKRQQIILVIAVAAFCIRQIITLPNS